jgi:hypothetical protein
MSKVTNNTRSVLGINVKDGDKVRSVSLAAGETRDLDVIETPVHKARVEAGKLTLGAKAAKAEKQGGGGGGSDTATLEAKHRGGGSYSVMDGDKELVEKLDKDQADKFNALDDAGKAAFIEANTKAP